MERIDNPEMEQYALQHLSGLYGIKKPRTNIHLSTLVYCLTSSYWDFTQYIEPTEEEVMLFSLGFGLQDVLTPQEASTPVFEKDGITYSPDFMMNGKLFEIKTTRMSMNRQELPETWIEYMMGGCYMCGANEYDLVILYMMGNYKPPFPRLHAETLKFSDEELEDNWQTILSRQAVLLDGLEKQTPPVPRVYCKDWECKYCRYAAICDAYELEMRDNENCVD